MFLQSYTLCAVYAIYLILGGIIFMYVEYEEKEKIVIIEHKKWTRLKEIAHSILPPDDEDELTNLIIWLESDCPTVSRMPQVSIHLTTVGNQSDIVRKIEENCKSLTTDVIETETVLRWSYIQALYFAMTVMTTIGYGHIAPKSYTGKIICILYSTIGIPLTLVLLAWTSSIFGQRLFDIYRLKVNKRNQRSQLFIYLTSFLYIIFGFFLFIFVPAFLFMYIEEWTYLESVYYAYITLTTIGFGDFVTGNNTEGVWLYVYQVGVIIWILAGLGYWVMVANFIVLALKSKKIDVMARKMAELKRNIANSTSDNYNPVFYQGSKISANFLMELATTLAAPEFQNKIGSSSTNGSTDRVDRPVIPGISALFSKQKAGGGSLFAHFAQAGAFNKMLQEHEANDTVDRKGFLDEEEVLETQTKPDSPLSMGYFSETENDMSSKKSKSNKMETKTLISLQKNQDDIEAREIIKPRDSDCSVDSKAEFTRL